MSTATSTWKPYWRVCWTTAAGVGIVNLVIFTVYASLPLVRQHKSGVWPDAPSWFDTAMATLNFPGVIIVGLHGAGKGPHERLAALNEIFFIQLSATIFWAVFAIWTKVAFDMLLRNIAGPRDLLLSMPHRD